VIAGLLGQRVTTVLTAEGKGDLEMFDQVKAAILHFPKDRVAARCSDGQEP